MIAILPPPTNSPRWTRENAVPRRTADDVGVDQLVFSGRLGCLLIPNPG
jgi:hypothetical protein